MEGSAKDERPHFVIKADGVYVCLVTNYSDRLNKCKARKVHSFTCAQDIRDGLDPNTKYYMVLNLPHAYFQIPLTPDPTNCAMTIYNWFY